MTWLRYWLNLYRWHRLIAERDSLILQGVSPEQLELPLRPIRPWSLA